jgi:hypothetical protein
LQRSREDAEEEPCTNSVRGLRDSSLIDIEALSEASMGHAVESALTENEATEFELAKHELDEDDVETVILSPNSNALKHKDRDAVMDALSEKRRPDKCTRINNLTLRSVPGVAVRTAEADIQ